MAFVFITMSLLNCKMQGFVAVGDLSSAVKYKDVTLNSTLDSNLNIY